MSISKAKCEAIEKAIRAKKCSYSCIANKFHVSVDEVRRIAKPLQQKWHAQNRARRELDRITEDAFYDRRPQQNSDNQCSLPVKVLAVLVVAFGVIFVFGVLSFILIGLGKMVLGA